MKGFNNLGNTCYLNAGLQMLIQNKDLCTVITSLSNIPDPVVLEDNSSSDIKFKNL